MCNDYATITVPLALHGIDDTKRQLIEGHAGTLLLYATMLSQAAAVRNSVGRPLVRY